MNVSSILVLAAAAPLLFALVCRLDAMTWRTAPASHAVNLALFVACCWVMWQALIGLPPAPSWPLVVLGWCWIAATWSFVNQQARCLR